MPFSVLSIGQHLDRERFIYTYQLKALIRKHKKIGE
jgi:hypothetical protein